MRKAAEQFYVLQQHRYRRSGARTADKNPFCVELGLELFVAALKRKTHVSDNVVHSL